MGWIINSFSDIGGAFSVSNLISFLNSNIKKTNFIQLVPVHSLKLNDQITMDSVRAFLVMYRALRPEVDHGCKTTAGALLKQKYRKRRIPRRKHRTWCRTASAIPTARRSRLWSRWGSEIWLRTRWKTSAPPHSTATRTAEPSPSSWHWKWVWEIIRKRKEIR